MTRAAIFFLFGGLVAVIVMIGIVGGAAFGADVETWTMSSGSTRSFTSPNIQSNFSIHLGGTGGAAVTIKPDGTIEYGPGYTPDAAAKVLWDAVGVERKARDCK